MKNSVTVVIPTRNRSELVLRALRSALAQTHSIERVVVVVDGKDDLTVSALRDCGDDRLAWIVLPESRGSNNARNVGAAAAESEWIAFLDDDDEWLPEKLEKQLEVAKEAEIVGCRFFAKSSKSTMIWPRVLPTDDRRFGDYLFSRRSAFNGEAAVITSTLMIRKSLFEVMPFSTTLRRHQDADWVIRATSKGAHVVYAPEALVQFDDQIGRVRISTSYNWRESLEWIRSVRHLMGRRAYAGFVLTSLGPAASDQREWGAFTKLLREAFTKGKPTLLHLVLYLGMWVFPQTTRQKLRSWFGSSKARKPILILREQSRA